MVKQLQIGQGFGALGMTCQCLSWVFFSSTYSSLDTGESHVLKYQQALSHCMAYGDLECIISQAGLKHVAPLLQCAKYWRVLPSLA